MHNWRAKQVAEYTGIPAETLRWMRNRGDGPPCFKIGSAVYYPKDGLDHWLSEQRVKAAVVA